MLSLALLSLHRALLLATLAVALTATGFAHRMPNTQDGALAFALANGAGAADFCGSISGGGGTATVHCPACQITAGATLPPVAIVPVDLLLCAHADVQDRRKRLALWSCRDPAHGPQGPPAA